MLDMEQQLLKIQSEKEAKELLEGKSYDFMEGFKAGHRWLAKYHRECLRLMEDNEEIL